jgi:L-gulonate 5-dehydrogenase
MKALIIDKPRSMKVADIIKPTMGDRDVMVKIKATGVCAGDVYIYQGKNPYAGYPIVGGHEIAGVISAIGKEVNSVKIGDRVVVDPFTGCGKCYACSVGKYNCCANLHILGVHSNGGFAEYMTAPAKQIYKVPDHLSLEIAAFCEPIAIGIQACNRAELVPGETVLVLGCGPIGMVIIEVARARGARVIASDINMERLSIAGTMGAETFLSGENLLPTILSLTNGEGIPVVIEATGVPAVMEQTVHLVAAGGRIVIVGLVPRGVGVSFPGLDITRKELTILGSRTNKGCFPEAIDMLATGKAVFPTLAKQFSMWDGVDLFAQLGDNPALYHKAILLNK